MSIFSGGDSTVATIVIRAINEAMPELKATEAQLTRIAAAGKESGASAAGAAGGLSLLSVGLLAVGAGAAYSIQQAEEFNHQLQVIQGNTGMTAKELEYVRQATMRLHEESPQALNDIATAYERAANLGYHFAQATDLVTAANKAAVATGGSTAEILQAIGTAMYNFHEPASRAAADTSILLKAASDANVRLPDMANNFSKVGVLAASMNIPLSDAAALYAGLTRAMGNAAAAQVQEVGMLQAILAPTKAEKDVMAELVKTTGIDLVQAGQELINKQITLKQYLDLVRDATGGNIQQQDALFGRIKGGLGALSQLNVHWQDYTHIQSEVNDKHVQTGKSLDDLYNKMNSRLGPELQRIKNNLQDISIVIGTELIPELEPMIKEFADATDKVGGLAKKVQGFVDIPIVKHFLDIENQLSPLNASIKVLQAGSDAVAYVWDGSWVPAAEHVTTKLEGFEKETVKTIASLDPGLTGALSASSVAASTWAAVVGGPWLQAATAATKATKDWATELDSNLNKALEAVAREQVLGQPVSQKQLDTIKALAAESLSYSDKLAALRAEYGLDTTATQRLNASLDATATAADSAGTKAETLKEKLARLRAELLGVADAANIAWQAITGGQWAGSPGLGSIGSGLGSVMSGGFGGGPAGGLGLGLGSLVPSVPSPTGTFTGPYGPFAGPGLLGAAGQGGNSAALPFGVSIAMPSFTPGVSGAGGDAGPSAGGFGVDLSGFGRVRDILGQIAAEQQKVDSGSLKLTADNSQIAAQSLQTQAQGIADLTSVMAAQSNVLSVDAQGTIQGINDQSAIARASYALSQANTPQARAAAQQQLVIAQQEADYHRQEAAVNHKIAEAGVKAAEDKAKWDKTIAADQAKADAAQLQVDSDSQQIQLDTLKVLTDGFTSLTGASVGTGLLSSPAEQRLAGDQNALSAAQGTLSSDQGLAAVNAAQDAQGIEVLREALARIMEQAGISGANGQLTMEQLSEAMQQNTAATTSNTQTTQQVKDQQDEMLRLYNEMKSLYSRGGTIRGGGNSVATSFSVFWDTRGAQANYTAAGRP